MTESGFHHGNPAELPLTQDVRQLIADARQESIRLDHEYIGTEHLVLALSHQADATGTFPALAIDPERVDATLSGIIERGQMSLDPSLERPFTSRTKHAFALAAETAHELGHADVGVPHVLVGLLRERLNIGAQVLADQGLTAERAYEYARGSGPTG